jgi:hypothetical protein
VRDDLGSDRLMSAEEALTYRLVEELI